MTGARAQYYRFTTALWNSALGLPGCDKGDTVSIVYFHGVHTPDMARVAPPPTSSMSAASFATNVQGLLRHYRVISLSDAVAMLSGRAPWRPKCVVLTFDDSLKCITDVALPILRRLGVTATIFLSTAAIDERAPYWWLRLDYACHEARRKRTHVRIVLPDTSQTFDCTNGASLMRMKSMLRKLPAENRDASVDAIESQVGSRLRDPSSQYPYATPLTWQDARDAAAYGFGIGSHTVSHPNLAVLSKQTALSELNDSKRAIEAQLSRACPHLSYPYGAYNSQVVEVARLCGYEAAVSTVSPGRNGLDANPFTLRRYPVPAASHKLPYVLSGAGAYLRQPRA
jgi:peptidoglycan/xylan/chitin deacetylase (PgdA/CDA1 family)